MVGSHTILSTKLEKIDASDLSFLKHEKWFEVDTLLKNSKIKFILSHYEGYPFDMWENEDYFILMEGTIYNFSEDEVEKRLKNIAEIFYENGKYL